MGDFYLIVNVLILQKLHLSLKYCHFCGKAIKQKASYVRITVWFQNYFNTGTWKNLMETNLSKTVKYQLLICVNIIIIKW